MASSLVPVSWIVYTMFELAECEEAFVKGWRSGLVDGFAVVHEERSFTPVGTPSPIIVVSPRPPHTRTAHHAGHFTISAALVP